MSGNKRTRNEFNDHKDCLRYLSDQMIKDKLTCTEITIKNNIGIFNDARKQYSHLMNQIYALGITKTNIGQHNQETIDKADLVAQEAKPLMVKINHYDTELNYYTDIYSKLQKELEIRKNGTKTTFFLESGRKVQFLCKDYVFFNPNLHHVSCIKYN